MEAVRVSDFIADFIHKQGVNHVFMVTGAGIMHLTDGVVSHPDLNYMCTHHEQSASMALEAYSRANQNLGVGYFTTGPGATNAITGLAGAWQDSVPCLFISGQSKRSEASINTDIKGLRQYGVQELNVIPIVESITKYAKILNEPNQIAYELEKAIHIAKSGRPGPVWLDIPMDVQGASINLEDLAHFVPDTEKPSKVNPESITTLKSLIEKSKRPAIIAGRGVSLSGAKKNLEKLSSTLNIPCVTPYLGIDNFEYECPTYIGKTGIKGDRPANYTMQNSDLIIAIGTSLHVSVIGYNYSQFAREASKVVIDIDMTSHQKKTLTFDLAIESDADLVISSLNRQRIKPKDESWLNRCQQWKKKYPVCIDEYQKDKSPLNIYSVVDEVCKKSEPSDIFISDAGSAFYAVSQGIKLKKDQLYIPSSAMATMGYSLPGAIGAAAASPDKRIIAFTGDGSLQQNIQELSVLAEYNMNIKLFILDNDGYLSIRNSQRNYFDGRYIGESTGSGLRFPCIDQISAAYGLKCIQLENIDSIEKVLDEVLREKGPVICNVICQPNQAIVPTVSSKVNEDGTMESRPLEDLAPFLSREEHRSNLLIPEI